MSDANPIPHPESQRLRHENEQLRTTLWKLLVEEDELRHIAKPHLEALYQTALGAWELRALEAQVSVNRLRRHLELAQAALNRGEPPDPAVIAVQLEVEFAAWQQQVRQAAAAIADAEFRLTHLASQESTKELRDLYFALVKRLHPDANPGQSEDARRLWHRVQQAHRAGDVAELRALSLLTTDAVPAEVGALAELAADQARLREQLRLSLHRLDALRATPPFSLRENLENAAWLEERRASLDQRTAELYARAVELRAKLSHALPHGGFDPGQN